MSVRWGKYIPDASSIAGALKSGFDWFQLPLGFIMEMNDEQFDRFAAKAIKNNTSFDVCDLNLPDDVIITQKGFNVYVWMEYLKKAIIRMAKLGCRAVVWSNGQARMLPEESDIMGAKEQVAQFLFLLSELSAQYAIRVLVEPLSSNYTNFLNTIEETAAFIKMITVENIGISISDNELSPDSLNTENLFKYKNLIQLIRLNKNITNEYNSELLLSLRISNYSSAIVLPENSGKNELAYCRRIWESASADVL